jgi:hypothetical protein
MNEEKLASWLRKCWGYFRGYKAPSDRDLLLLTPFQQYKTYHRFPFMVVIHVVLLMFLSINTVLLSNEYTDYSQANEQVFEGIFLPHNVRSTGIYNLPDTLHLIEEIVETVSEKSKKRRNLKKKKMLKFFKFLVLFFSSCVSNKISTHS